MVDYMGITKQQLKDIVKECLVEILAEGIGPSTKPALQEAAVRSHNRQTSPVKQTVAPRRGDHVKYGHTMAETIKRESKGNPVMASILADTAMNTLPSMMNETTRQQPPPPAGSIESIVASAAPEELFGDEASSKWAQLAFMETPKKF